MECLPRLAEVLYTIFSERNIDFIVTRDMKPESLRERKPHLASSRAVYREVSFWQVSRTSKIVQPDR